jgi:hypothetical protein
LQVAKPIGLYGTNRILAPARVYDFFIFRAADLYGASPPYRTSGASSRLCIVAYLFWAELPMSRPAKHELIQKRGMKTLDRMKGCIKLDWRILLLTGGFIVAGGSRVQARKSSRLRIRP